MTPPPPSRDARPERRRCEIARLPDRTPTRDKAPPALTGFPGFRRLDCRCRLRDNAHTDPASCTPQRGGDWPTIRACALYGAWKHRLKYPRPSCGRGGKRKRNCVQTKERLSGKPRAWLAKSEGNTNGGYSIRWKLERNAPSDKGRVKWMDKPDGRAAAIYSQRSQEQHSEYVNRINARHQRPMITRSTDAERALDAWGVAAPLHLARRKPLGSLDPARAIAFAELPVC